MKIKNKLSESQIKLYAKIYLRFCDALFLFLWLENYLNIRPSLSGWEKPYMLLNTVLAFILSSLLMHGAVNLGLKARNPKFRNRYNIK